MREGKQCLRLVQLQAYREAQKELEGPSTSSSPPMVPSPQMPELLPMDIPDPALVMTTPPPKEQQEEAKNPFEMLIKAAKLQNPKQFDVPGEIMVYAPLPGSIRTKTKYEMSKHYRKPHELDNGIIPLPAKLCFKCTKSCRVAPLIQCDYCPLLFHKDCVDPPLTTMPTGRWMCPNHPERGLAKFEAGLHTEKCQIFNDFHGRLNQDTVKFDFMKMLSRTGPPRKDHTDPLKRKSISVPNAIKSQYSLPPVRLPHPHEKPCSLNALPQGLESTEPGCTQEEQEEWLKGVVALQTSITRYIAQKTLPKDPNIKQKIITASSLVNKQQTNSSSSSSSSPVVVAPSTATVGGVASGRVVGPATSLSASLSANAKLPSSAEVAAESAAKSRDDVVEDSRKPESRCTNGPVNVNGPYIVNRTSSPRAGSFTNVKPDPPSGKNTIVVKDTHLLNHRTRLQFSDGGTGTQQGSVVNTDLRGGHVQQQPHGEATTNGPTTLNGGKYTNNAISKGGNTTVIHKVVGNASSTAYNTAPPRAIGSGNNMSAHPTMKIVTQNNLPSTKPMTTVGRVSSGTMLSASSSSQSQHSAAGGKVMTIQSAAGSSKPSSSGNIAAAVPAKISPASLSSSPAIINLNSSLQACIEGTNEVELTKLDDRLVQILAWQRLQQLLPQKAPPTSTTTTTASRKPSNQTSNTTTTTSTTTAATTILPTTPSPTSPPSNQVQARAMFCPLNGKGPGSPVAMCFRTLQIGTGSDNDVCLASYGHCNYVSPKHACIFFDETTKHYELLNYSEHGTTVDNVLYSCDFSEKNTMPPPATSFVKSVRKIASKKRKKDNSKGESSKSDVVTIKEEKCEINVKTEPKDLVTMSAVSSDTRTPCNCKGSSSCLIGGTGAGWEGTALLHHGSYIRMGCLQFVFSIAEFVTKPKVVEKSMLRTQLVRSNTPPV